MMIGLLIGGVAAAIAAAFLLSGGHTSGVQGIERAVGEIQAPPLAGRTVVAVAAGVVLTLAGLRLGTTISGQDGFRGDMRDMNANLFGSTTPGSITVDLKDVPMAAVNSALSQVTGQSPTAWKEDPTGAVFIQNDGKYIRVGYVDTTVINNHSQTSLKIITYDKNNAPVYVSELAPDRSYKALIDEQGSVNSAATSAARNQTILVRSASSALASGDIVASSRLLSTAASYNHDVQ